MTDESFPESVPNLVETLVAIYRVENQEKLVELLGHAAIDVELANFDNWNGGTYTWRLMVMVPVETYAVLGKRREQAEKDILSKLEYFGKQHENQHFGEVSILPAPPGSSPVRATAHPSDPRLQEIWTPRRFRLFLSHLSTEKKKVAAFKEKLGLCGISAFVAHEDIEPSTVWQERIELALRSMDALGAILTDGFHRSPWTDQEVGWALGRAVPVLSVRCGLSPYGLFGKYQAIPGSLDEPAKLAVAFAQTLLKHEQTRAAMRRSLFSSFVESDSYLMTQALNRMIQNLPDISTEERKMLLAACKENKNVSEAYYITGAVYKKLGLPYPVEQPAEDATDIPF